ncbi:MAG: carboxypeptidase regulatory-like domain-containing protein [Bacteroidota bacterium]
MMVSAIGWSQDVSQVVRGVITDQATGRVLSGVALSLKKNEFTVAGAVSDSSGGFELKASPGRYALEASHLGYQTLVEELLVTAGKENNLRFTLTELATELQEVSVVAASYNPAPGAFDISIEKTLRVPANFFDPLRMAASYPGMVAANDQGNALAVKGYSPNALLWKIDGLDIVNPNHLANAGTLGDKPVSFGGGVSILSSQVLDKTSIYSGWLPAQYGNALSAVVDMGMRAGNKNRHEFTAQASLIGLDLAAEGPLSYSGKSSYLANYRYSTVGLLSSAGLDFGDEAINFQDFTFHLDFDQDQNAHLSVFGFAGLSSNRFQRKPQDEWETEKDRYNIDFEGQVFGVGFTEQWGNKVRWKWGSSLSGQFQDRRSESDIVPIQQYIYRERFNSDHLLWSNQLSASTKLGESRLQAGALVNYLHNELAVETVTPLYFDTFFPNLSGIVSGALVQPYLNLSRQFARSWQLDAGMRYVYFTYNNSTALEPRLNVQRLFASGSLSLGYARTSQWQQAQAYLLENNRDLKLSVADQLMLEYRRRFNDQSSLVASAYIHSLNDVPVAPGSHNQPYWSMLNQWDEFPVANMTSVGQGMNRGVEVAYEKRFFNQFYFLVNGSVYQSQYKAPETQWQEGRFSGGYTSGFLIGKEWGSDRSFGVHVRFLYLGGLRHPTIDMLNSVNYGTTIYAGSGYPTKLPDYWRPDLRVAWRKNKPGYTRTLSIDIQNVASRQNVAYYYYDTFTGRVETKLQLGIIPVLVYRVDF